MTELMQVYRCSLCGNTVSVLHAGEGQLVCCGQPMELQKENTEDASQEKHVPVVEKTENGVTVKVGSEEHPMLSEHHIEWIEVSADGIVQRKFLSPGDEPKADFTMDAKAAGSVTARAYCNLHGLWASG
ncbi:MAG: desulfoferrodoxin [Candidatus Aenigmarchaeota archaeon]|nr:desulfoferrodoxin [Candidatus Aenigmarchaeota archaeon]